MALLCSRACSFDCIDKVKKFPLVSRAVTCILRNENTCGNGYSLGLPNHNQSFDIDCESNASNCQFGAVIREIEWPVASHSWKMVAAQMNHMTIEKEVLGVAAVERNDLPNESNVWLRDVHFATRHIHTRCKRPSFKKCISFCNSDSRTVTSTIFVLCAHCVA